MKTVFLGVLEASFYGSVVILAVLLLRQLLKKASRSVFCLLWLLAGLRLMLPLRIESGLSLQPRLEPVSQTVDVPLPGFISTSTAPAEPAAPEQIGIQNPDTGAAGSSYDEMESTSYLYIVDGNKIRPMDYGDVGAYIWLAGVLGLCVSSFVSYGKLKRKVREACLLKDGSWECPGLDTAFVLGFLPPRIYLPAGLSDRDREFIFDHEKAHIARRDHWWKLLGYGVLAVHWFNPLVWAAYSMLCRDIELACDERVVKHMTVEQRKAYSKALLNCGSRHLSISACPVAFGEVSIKQRILSVLRYKKPGFWISLVAVTAVIFVAVCLMTSPSREPDLSFLNYENAISLAAEQQTVMTIYCDESAIRPAQVEGSALAGYLDNAQWSEKWFTPGDTSSPGSVEFVIGDDYRITVYDRDFARVKYGEEVRYYRMGRGDYEKAKELLKTSTSAQSPDMTLERCCRALEEFQRQESYYVSVWMAYENGNTTQVETWQAGDNWLTAIKANGADQSGYMKRDAAYYMRRFTGLSANWTGGFTLEEENGYLPWLRVFDWNAADIRVVRQGVQGEIETLPFGEGPFETVFCTVASPFESEKSLNLTFDGAGELVCVELAGDYEAAEGYSPELTQITTHIIPTDREEIAAKLDGAYAEVPESERSTIADAYIEKCRAAVEAFQNQNTYCLMTEYQFGGDILNDSATRIVYGNGGDWLRQDLISGGTEKEEIWYLEKDGQQFRRSGLLRTDSEYGLEQVSSTGWEKATFAEGEVSQPWLRTFQWDAQEVRFVSYEKEERQQRITVLVEGQPGSAASGVREYTVTFVFRSGALYQVLMSYTETWPMLGEEQTAGVGYVASTTSLQPMAPEDAANMIDAMFAQAVGEE